MTTSAVTPDATSVLGGDDSARDFDAGAQSAPPQAQAPASQAAPASPQAQTPQPQSPGQITPQQPQGQGQATPPHHGLLSDIVKAVGSILGGPTDVSTIDPHTGDIVRVPLSRSARIANTAGILLRGAAAGAAQHGPGSVGKAALAGVQEQQGAQEQQQQQLQEQAKTTQGALAQQASHALQQQQMAESAWRMQREKTEVDEASADKLNSYRQLVASDPANKDWGHYESFADFADQHQDLQKQGVNLAQLQAQGKLIAVPTTEDGKITGVNVFQVGPDWAKQKNTEPITIKRPSGVDAKGAVQYDSVTIPAGAVDNGTMMSYWASGAKDGMDAAEKQAQIERAKESTEIEKEKAPSEIAEAKAGAALKGAQAKNLESGGKDENGNWNPSSIPVSLVEGNMDPSQLSKRSVDYNAKLQAANQYSLEKYGRPFDIAQAQSDYKYATAPQTQNTLKLIKGMTDPNGAIDIAQNAAKSLPRVDEATLNKVFNATATEFGSKEATNFHTAMLGLADEYSKVMGGGTATDTGRKQALDVLKASYSKGQLAGAIGVMRQDIAARQNTLVGDNRYLKKQYGTTPPPPAGATHAVYVNNRIVGYSSDGGKTMTPVTQ